MFKHILIPTDGSVFSVRAASQGLMLAKAAGARVTGLFVAPAPTPLVFEGLVPVAYMQPEDHAKLSEQVAARLLGDIESAARQAGVPFEAVVVVDEFPADAIVREAAKRQCDLIVMGSHGRRGLASMLLGSETVKVLTHARQPVLVCR